MTITMYEVEKMLRDRYSAIKPEFRSGDTVNVFYHMVNKGKEVEKILTGVCIRVTKSSFCIRNTKTDLGMEYNFSFYVPTRVEIAKYGKLRQGRPYYWRNLSRKDARIPSDFKRQFKKVNNKGGEA